MTHEQWMTLLAPVISSLVLGIAAMLGLVLSGLTARLKAYLDAKGEAEASKVITDASTRMQAAMQNAAGQIALEIQAGRLDITDINQIRAAAFAQAIAIEKKLPDATATLKPAPGAISDGVIGKVAAQVVSPPPPTLVPDTEAEPEITGSTFQARAAGVVARIMRDLGLTREMAAGIVGNLGHESGLQAINEIHPVAGRGGFGWAQWTGPRRTAFEAWCSAHGMQVTDPEANYGFLLAELRGPESAALDALRQTSTLEEATRVFEERFERAGVVAMGKRIALAQLAMAA